MANNNPLRIVQSKVNEFWREYGYHHGHVRLRNLPEIFAIEATNYCNLKCVMCPRGEPDIMDRALGHMSSSLFEKILDEAKFFGDPCWFHWFGEPLMNPKLFEQIEIAKRKGVPNLGISTNATLLNARNSGQILDSGLDTVLIAIDGTSKEVYEHVRKSSEFTFEEVTDNARSFLQLKKSSGRVTPHTILSMIYMQDTRDQAEEFSQFWRAQGADEVISKDFVTWGNQTSDFIELAAIEQRASLAQPRPRNFPCKHLWQSVIITWNGRVVPCCYDFNATMEMGDLNRQTLAEVWNGEQYVRLRERELSGSNGSPLCRNCVQAPGHARNPKWPI